MSETRKIVEPVRHPIGRIIERTVPVTRLAKVRLKVLSVELEMSTASGQRFVTLVERVKNEGE